MHVEEAIENEFNIIRDIAYKTWPVTYKDILSEPQLKYMLELFYSDQALTASIGKGHIFFLVWDEENPIAFAEIENNYKSGALTRIHKIYVLPNAQGRGAGQLLVDHIEERANIHRAAGLSLNVNRNNNARAFYERNGFIVSGSEDVPLEHGYLMEDYIMEKHFY